MITPKPNFKSSVLKLFIELNYIVCKNYMFTNCYYGFVFILHHRSDKMRMNTKRFKHMFLYIYQQRLMTKHISK